MDMVWIMKPKVGMTVFEGRQMQLSLVKSSKVGRYGEWDGIKV